MAKLILIGGVSRSGKSSLAQYLTQHLPLSIHIDQDTFVLPEPQIPTIKDRTDWEVPESIDWKKLDTTTTNYLNRYEFVILEGIFAFQQESLNQLADLKIELKLPKEEFLAKRKQEQRWGEEPQWFIEHVWKAHLIHSNPHNTSIDLTFSSMQTHQFERILKKIKLLP